MKNQKFKITQDFVAFKYPSSKNWPHKTMLFIEDQIVTGNVIHKNSPFPFDITLANVEGIEYDITRFSVSADPSIDGTGTKPEPQRIPLGSVHPVTTSSQEEAKPYPVIKSEGTNPVIKPVNKDGKSIAGDEAQEIINQNSNINQLKPITMKQFQLVTSDGDREIIPFERQALKEFYKARRDLISALNEEDSEIEFGSVTLNVRIVNDETLEATEWKPYAEYLVPEPSEDDDDLEKLADEVDDEDDDENQDDE